MCREKSWSGRSMDLAPYAQMLIIRFIMVEDIIGLSDIYSRITHCYPSWWSFYLVLEIFLVQPRDTGWQVWPPIFFCPKPRCHSWRFLSCCVLTFALCFASFGSSKWGEFQLVIQLRDYVIHALAKNDTRFFLTGSTNSYLKEFH